MIEEVIQYVCKEYHLKREVLMDFSQGRQAIVCPRQLVFYTLVNLLDFNPTAIAYALKTNRRLVTSGVVAMENKLQHRVFELPDGYETFVASLQESHRARVQILQARMPEIKKRVLSLTQAWLDDFEKDPFGMMARSRK